MLVIVLSELVKFQWISFFAFEFVIYFSRAHLIMQNHEERDRCHIR